MNDKSELVKQFLRNKLGTRDPITAQVTLANNNGRSSYGPSYFDPSQNVPMVDFSDTDMSQGPGDDAAMIGMNPGMPKNPLLGPSPASAPPVQGPPESLASDQDFYDKLTNQLANSVPHVNLQDQAPVQGPAASLASKPKPPVQSPVPQVPSMPDLSDRMPAGGGMPPRPDYLIPNLMKAFSNVNRGAMAPVDNGLANDMNKQTQFQQDLITGDMDRANKVKQYMLQKQLQQQGKAQDLDNAMKLSNLNFANKKDLEKYKNGLPLRPRSQLDPNKDFNNTQTQIKTGNTLLKDSNIALEIKKLNAARGGQALLKEIADNKLVPTNNVKNMLNNLVITTEMGGPGSVEERKHAGVDNIYTVAANALNFWRANPGSTLPQPIYNQLKTELHTLGDRSAQNYSNLLKYKMALSEADPGTHEKIKHAGETFLKSSGYDMDGNSLENPSQPDFVMMSPPPGKSGVKRVPRDQVQKWLQQGAQVLQ